MPNWIALISDEDRSKVKGWVSKAPPGTMIAFRKQDARSIEQNALMWSLLSAISESVEHCGVKLAPEEWKDLFTASLRSYRVMPGLNAGTVVPLGLRTSSMSRKEMNELIEHMTAFAADNGVEVAA